MFNGACITFKDCDSCWHPDVLELIKPVDKHTAFITDFQALLRKHNVTLKCQNSANNITDYLTVIFNDDENLCWSNEEGIITTENVVDFYLD